MPVSKALSPIGGIEMARIGLARQALSDSGKVAMLMEAEPDGNSFINDGHTVLFVQNGRESAVTVTVQSGYYRGLKLEDRVISVPAGVSMHIGPFDVKAYNQSVGEDAGRVYVDYSEAENVSIAVLSMSAE